MDDAEGIRKQTFRYLLPKWKGMLNKRCSRGNLKATVRSFAINGTQPSLTEQCLLWMVPLTINAVSVVKMSELYTEAASHVSGRACWDSCIGIVND